MKNNIIEIENLNYKVLNDFDMTIKQGEFVTISGANNTGKTTLIRLLNNEIKGINSIKVNNIELNNWKVEEYYSFCQAIIPLEISFQFDTLEEELFNINYKKEDYKTIISTFKLKNILNKKISLLTKKEIIISQLIIGLLKSPKLLLIDNISPYFSKTEKKDILSFLNDYRNSHDLTIIYTTIELEDSLSTDKLIIINNGDVFLQGKPIEILKKDNLINKLGLDIPFMIDLSVKLKDYDLIKEIELDTDRMLDSLWK